MADQEPIRILLIEDDEISVFLFKRIISLQWPSFQVHVCATGECALKLLSHPETEVPHIIVADVNLPIMGGFEFYEEFKKSALFLTSKIQFVVATSSLQQTDRERAVALNASHFIIKPVSVENLQPVITNAKQLLSEKK